MEEITRDQIIEAIDASIDKWEKIARYGKKIKDPRAECPLCLLFNHEDMFRPDKCQQCPVKKKTGDIFCLGTPFDKLSQLSEHKLITVQNKETRKLAREEVLFLKSVANFYRRSIMSA